MNSLRTFLALARKELWHQAQTRWAALNRLLVGPAVSALTAGILYAGFFSANHELKLGSLDADNFRSILVMGFLAHNFLNAGYYSLFNKLAYESYQQTLALIWMAPGNRLLQLLGLLSLELLRCLTLTVLALLASQNLSLIFRALPILLLIFGLGMSLGFIRAVLFLADDHRGEWLDNFYWLFVFSACLYIPKELLPVWVQPVVALNPLHQLFRCLSAPNLSSLAWGLTGFVVLATLAGTLWRARRFQVFERTLS